MDNGILLIYMHHNIGKVVTSDKGNTDVHINFHSKNIEDFMFGYSDIVYLINLRRHMKVS